MSLSWWSRESTFRDQTGTGAQRQTCRGVKKLGMSLETRDNNVFHAISQGTVPGYQGFRAPKKVETNSFVFHCWRPQTSSRHEPCWSVSNFWSRFGGDLLLEPPPLSCGQSRRNYLVSGLPPSPIQGTWRDTSKDWPKGKHCMLWGRGLPVSIIGDTSAIGISRSLKVWPFPWRRCKTSLFGRGTVRGGFFKWGAP